MAADLLLENGRVVTMAGRPAQALAVVGGRVLAVGSDEELAPLRSRETRTVNLRGRLALPGFTDSHLHLGALAGWLSEIQLEPALTMADALRRVARRAGRTPTGGWISGGGFDKNRWGDAFPTRGDLDRVAPHHPVALRSRDGHTLWLNSLALKRCGITRKTPTPAGGVIARDPRGEPTGVLQEAATQLVSRGLSFAGGGPDCNALRRAVRFLLRRGITSVHLMEEMPLLDALHDLRRAGGLSLRVTLYRRAAALDDLVAAGVRSGFGDEWLRIGGIKIMCDGALGSQTAWLFRPYRNNMSAGCGVPRMPIEELRDLVARAAEAGLACAVHAIGDRANAEVLRAFERTAEDSTSLPHRVEHAQLVRPHDIARLGRLRSVIASMQPCHIVGDIDIAERYWGRRCRHAYPVASLLDAGVTLAFGSDAPVETADPMVGLYAATRRQTLDGRPRDGWYRREEAIGMRAALRAYTVGPAIATGERSSKGRLAPGYLADIVVLPRDITRLRGRAMLEVRPDVVIVGGRVRYRRNVGG